MSAITPTFPGSDQNSPYLRHRQGGWLPHDPKHFEEWLQGTLSHVRKHHQKPKSGLHQSIQDFWDLLEHDTQARMYFSMMFEQVPNKYPYTKDPTGQAAVQSWHEMLLTFDYLLTQGPTWLYTTDGQKGLIGFPFNAVLDWPMGTAAGISVFLRPEVNERIKAMLDEYGKYLSSPDSCTVLDSTNWFSDQALSAMGDVASQSGTTISFADAYECIPEDPAGHYGYTSWDDFFIRKFKPGVREVYTEDPNTIVNCCESTPFALQTNVHMRDKFWLKSQPYSLEDMLGSRHLALNFKGGTVYQAFLSALSYHCWHAPVSGTVVDVYKIPGSYYAENYWEGFANVNATTNEEDPDPAGPDLSQGYIAQVAARGVLVIDTDEPKIGLIAIVQIGMAEVSTVQWTVSKNQYIKKGEDIGMFHFGGSTHCLVFQPNVKLDFERPPPYDGSGTNCAVKSLLARVTVTS